MELYYFLATSFPRTRSITYSQERHSEDGHCADLAWSGSSKKWLDWWGSIYRIILINSEILFDIIFWIKNEWMKKPTGIKLKINVLIFLNLSRILHFGLLATCLLMWQHRLLSGFWNHTHILSFLRMKNKSVVTNIDLCDKLRIAAVHSNLDVFQWRWHFNPRWPDASLLHWLVSKLQFFIIQLNGNNYLFV